MSSQWPASGQEATPTPQSSPSDTSLSPSPAPSPTGDPSPDPGGQQGDTPPPDPPLPVPPPPDEPTPPPGPHPEGPGSKGDDRDRDPGSKAVCSTLSWTQTYRGWGPALAYGRAVTIRFVAQGCSVIEGKSLDLLRRGTARIYAGRVAKRSRFIESRPFSVRGVWEDPENPLGWPPLWWQCGVSGAWFTWHVRGVYTFEVGVEDGVWSLDVSTNRKRRDHHFSWSYDGCSG
jgi:hypothetical protein